MFVAKKYNSFLQYFVSSAVILLLTGICYSSKEIMGYKIVALILLMGVSFLAMLFDIFPVLIAAILSALIWNFFFIPPVFTFHINNTEDLLMFFLYFIIALVNAVLTFKIRKAESLARDKQEKENTIKLYNTLLNSLSHELRTPIATILGAVDTLKENKDKLSLANENELLTQIDRASIRLNKQVENLLNMSRLETGFLKLNIQWIDVNEFINGVIYKMNANVHHQKIVFITNDNLPLCKIDSGVMEQVVHNIIANGILYTPETATIKVTATVTNGVLIVIIADNGLGIPNEHLPNIFTKFYRGGTTKTGGIGLGLSIVKGFVEVHGGSITAQNNDDGGAKFIIGIPTETTYLTNLKNE